MTTRRLGSLRLPTSLTTSHLRPWKCFARSLRATTASFRRGPEWRSTSADRCRYVSSAHVLGTRMRGSAWSPIATIGHVTLGERAMAEKSKGGREVRKPKAEKNKKVKGQTPP